MTRLFIEQPLALPGSANERRHPPSPRLTVRTQICFFSATPSPSATFGMKELSKSIKMAKNLICFKFGGLYLVFLTGVYLGARLEVQFNII